MEVVVHGGGCCGWVLRVDGSLSRIKLNKNEGK